MRNRKVLYLLITLFLLGAGITIAGGGLKAVYRPDEKAFYLSQALETFLQPGLNLVIQKVDFTPPTVAVTFRISDNNNQGLDRLGVNTSGPINIGWTIARIRPGDTQYTSYYSIPPAGICQPKDFTDGSRVNGTGAYNGVGGGGPNCTYGPGGGTYQDLGDGTYKYTFALQIPSNYDANSTTTIGTWAMRNLLAFDLGVANANAVYTFVPSGAPVAQVRDVVTTKACTQACHDHGLGAHGLPPVDFDRRDTRLCVLCHAPDKINPETGNTLDMKVFFHKIHMGANLPSVSGRPLNINGMSGSGTSTTATGATQSPIPPGYDPTNLKSVGLNGKPYQINVSSEDEIFDGTTIVVPQDIRNCTTCHQGGTQSDNWKTNPSRAACGSCHDDVNFATGANHGPNNIGGPQADDTNCTICHKADTGLEFDLSITGAHTMPWKSKQLAGLNITITGVSNATPGSRPTVWFKVTDGKGNPVDATKLNSLGFILAGPTSDYIMPGGVPATENALPWVQATTGGFFYTFAAAIPSTATGTFTVGGQGYRLVNINGPAGGPVLTVRESANNALFNFAVGGAAVTPRRTVVDVKNCNTCHETLALHGGTRKDTQYCVLCHNPSAHDTQAPAQTVNFKTHIHRIHMGVETENDWIINGTNNFGGVRYPGDPRNCAKCHVNNSNQLPLPDGLANADTPRLQFSPMGPIAQACLGCHDGDDAAAHAFLQTAPFGESCPVCHEEGADFAVSKVHVRNEFWGHEDAR